MRKFALYFVFFIETFIKRHITQLGLSLIIGFFVTLFVFQVYPYFQAKLVRKHEQIGIIGNFNRNNLPKSVLNKISLGLTFISQDGQASPAAALSWEVVNNIIYTFHLKPNLFWHDGIRFTAEDLKYKIKDSKLSRVDNYTFKIELNEPFSPLAAYLTNPILKENFIGLGPYKVLNVIYGPGGKINQITLLPFDKKLSSITYKFYNNLKDEMMGFKLGEIEILENIDNSENFVNWRNLKIETKTDYTRVVSLFYNFNDSRLKEKEIRQALAYAIPLFNEYDKAASPISPFSWAYSQKIRLYKYDPQSAKKILAKSQLASTSSELILTSHPTLLKSAQKIVDAWNSIGIKSKVKVDLTIPSDYQVLLKNLQIPPDPDQYLYWQSTQENSNISNYVSPKIDKLLEDGRKTHDQNERKKIYADFQFYLVDDAPAIFLYYPKLYTVSRN